MALFKKFCNRSFFVCVETIAIITLVLAIIIGVSVWRLTSGPIDVSLAKNYIESALYDEDNDISARLTGISLSWPEITGPVYLILDQADIIGPDQSVLFSFESAQIGLSRGNLLIGRIAPKSIILRGPVLHIQKTAEKGWSIALSGQDEITQPAQNEEEQQGVLTGILDTLAEPGKSGSSPLAYLEVFDIQDARVLIEDYMRGISWFLPNFDTILSSTDEGLSVVMDVEIPGGPNNAATSNIQLFYDWQSKQTAIKGFFQEFDIRMFAGKIEELDFLEAHDVVFNAETEILLDPSFSIRNARTTFYSENGFLSLDDLYADPLNYDRIAFEIDYNDASGTKTDMQSVSIQNIQIAARDIVIEGSAETEINANFSVFNPVIRLGIAELPQSAIDPLWPDTLRNEPAYEWLTQKMADGKFYDLKAELGFDIAYDDDSAEWTMEPFRLGVDGRFEGMSVDYRAPLMPVKNVTGKGYFAGERLDIRIESATLGDMAVKPSILIFDDIIQAGQGKADLTINIEGPLQTALKYVSPEPIGFGDKLTFDVNQVQGRADLNVNLKFPATKKIPEDSIKAIINGKVTDAFLPDIIQSMPLRGGPFNLAFRDGLFSLDGQGQLDQTPISLKWDRYAEPDGKTYKMKVRAQLSTSEAMRQRFGIDLSDFAEGPADLRLLYTEYNDNTAHVDVDANLKATRLYLDPFDYEKMPGPEAGATLEVLLENETVREIRNLNVSAPDMTVTNGRIIFRQTQEGEEPERASLDLKTGETNITLDIETATNGLQKYLMKGTFLDLRPFLNNDTNNEYEGPPVIASVDVTTMRTSDVGTVKNAKLYIDIAENGNFNQLEMDAIAENGAIYLRYKQDQTGMRTFRFEADDAGGFFRAFDVYRNIIGGKLTIYAEPIRGIMDRNLIGNAILQNFSVRDAPVLARLVGALSLPGIGELLNNEGIAFTRLETEFDWLYRPQGSLLILKNGTTAGNSLGLTFDGQFDNALNTLDVTGTIVPLSGINKVIGTIPVLGNILTGGSGGVFAATYSLRGPSSDVKVSVNPLSVLAPGILRRILFEEN